VFDDGEVLRGAGADGDFFAHWRGVLRGGVADCLSGVCNGITCQPPTPFDGIKNGGETGIDCGYPGGPPYTCKNFEGCHTSTDCISRVCYNGYCQVPTCYDATMNGFEQGVDCGGLCPPCSM
jgi:hypothetical protein